MHEQKRKKKKSQNSVGLFKIEVHLQYLQDVTRSYFCPMSFYIWWFNIFQRCIATNFNCGI